MLPFLQGIGSSLLMVSSHLRSICLLGRDMGVNITQLISSSGTLNLLVYLQSIFLLYIFAWVVPLFNSSLCLDETTSERSRMIALCKLYPALIIFYLMSLLYFSSEYWNFITYLYFYLFAICLLHYHLSAMKAGAFPSPLLNPKNLKYYLTTNIQNYLFSEWMKYSKALKIQASYVWHDSALNLYDPIGRNTGKIFKDKGRQNITAFSD